MSIVQELHKKGLIKPPPYVVGGVQYETIMGSEAYAVSSGNSDTDVYGFCIPGPEVIFPHLAGHIEGFGRQRQGFEQFQEHHIIDKDALGGKGREYDITIYNIVKYFALCMECNPNMIDSMFTPVRCVLHVTKVGNIVRDNRKLFLHKGAWHKFKGYAYAQVHKMQFKGREDLRKFQTKHGIPEDMSPEDYQNKQPQYVQDQPDFKRILKNYTEYWESSRKLPENEKRADSVKTIGYDVKFAYHVVRLLAEVEQILIEGNLDLERNREQLKSIRRGEWTQEQIMSHFQTKEKDLETVYTQSTLRHSPDEDAIKKLLLSCLEEHYGSLDKYIIQPEAAVSALRDIQTLANKALGVG